MFKYDSAYGTFLSDLFDKVGTIVGAAELVPQRRWKVGEA